MSLEDMPGASAEASVYFHRRGWREAIRRRRSGCHYPLGTEREANCICQLLASLWATNRRHVIGGYAAAVKLRRASNARATPSTPKSPQGWYAPAARLDDLQIPHHLHHGSYLSLICLSRRRRPVLIRRAATIGNSAVYDMVQSISPWKTTTGEPLLKVCSRSFQGDVV